MMMNIEINVCSDAYFSLCLNLWLKSENTSSASSGKLVVKMIQIIKRLFFKTSSCERVLCTRIFDYYTKRIILVNSKRFLLFKTSITAKEKSSTVHCFLDQTWTALVPSFLFASFFALQARLQSPFHLSTFCELNNPIINIVSVNEFYVPKSVLDTKDDDRPSKFRCCTPDPLLSHSEYWVKWMVFTLLFAITIFVVFDLIFLDSVTR